MLSMETVCVLAKKVLVREGGALIGGVVVDRVGSGFWFEMLY